jgi:hypothetical protein
MKSPSLFLPVAAFEWRHQRRSPAPWVGFALFFLLTFAATTIDQIQIGSRGRQHQRALRDPADHRDHEPVLDLHRRGAGGRHRAAIRN